MSFSQLCETEVASATQRCVTNLASFPFESRGVNFLNQENIFIFPVFAHKVPYDRVINEEVCIKIYVLPSNTE